MMLKLLRKSVLAIAIFTLIVGCQVLSPNPNCIDLNTASSEQLQEIIQIGPARSQAIIEERPWKRVEDLERIRGISSGRVNLIKEQGLACVKRKWFFFL